MITFARVAISRIAVYISSARDQTMAKPVPPPIFGCQSGETDHGLPGSSSKDGHRRFISSMNRAISGPTGDQPLFLGVQQLPDFRDGPRT